MTHIKPTGPEGRGKPPERPPPLKKSPLAEQIPSTKEELIDSYLERSWLMKLPLIGKFIEMGFGELNAKKNYIQKIQKLFIVEVTKNKAYPPELAELVAEKYLGRALRANDIEDIRHIEHFIKNGGSIFFIERGKVRENVERVISFSKKSPEKFQQAIENFHALSKMGKRSIEDQRHILGFLMRPVCNDYVTELLAKKPPPDLDKALKEIVAAMKKNPRGVERILDTAPLVFYMLKSRFTPDDRLAYYQSWVQLAGQIDSKRFDIVVKGVTEFYREAYKLQLERPKVYSSKTDKERVAPLAKIENITGNKHYAEFFIRGSLRRAIIDEVIQLSVAFNTQPVHENIASCYKTPEKDARTIPSLRKRSDYSFCLSREFHPDITLLEDSDEYVDLVDFRMRLSITNEKTMETRTVRVPLPIAGRMTKTEARKLLEILERSCGRPDTFGEQYDKSGLPKEQKREVEAVFLSWVEQLDRAMFEAVFDFNATETRKEFAFAREKPEVAAAIADPNNAALALEVAKGENLFKLEDGRLSLLPPEIANPIIGEITATELKEAEKCLKGEAKNASIALPGGKGEVSVVYRPEVLEGNDVAWIETTISRGDHTYTRKTLLELGEGEERITAEKMRTALVTSGRFERELLLTKAEFMESVDRLQFATFPERLAQTLPEATFVERALLLNFMTSLEGRQSHLLLDSKLPLQKLLNMLKEDPDTARIAFATIGDQYQITKENEPRFREILASFIGTKKENLKTLVEAAKLSPLVFQMMGRRFTPNDQLTYIENWIQMANDKTPQEFSETLSRFKAYLETAQSIQSERPTLYTTLEKKVIPSFQMEFLHRFDGYPFLEEISDELAYETVIWNTQLVQENIMGLYTSPEETRTVYNLDRPGSTRIRNKVFSLSREFIADIELFNDSDEIIDFNASTNLYMTNEKTMETRCLRIPLPIKGKMTVTEARKYLKVLDITIMDPKSFDKEYAKQELPPEKKESVKKDFLRFEEETMQAYGKILADFNDAPTRPAFTFAREDPAIAAAIASPTSLLLLIEVVKRRNIFLDNEGNLSLLPPECAQAQIGQITEEEINKAFDLLLKGGEPLSMTLPQKKPPDRVFFDEGKLSFSFQEEEITGKHMLRLKTTITRGEESHTRETLYELKEGQTAQDKFKEIRESRLFERDLLLAKAEFIDAHL